MNQILHCDWLPVHARWSDTACSGLPVLFLQENFAKVQAGAQEFSCTTELENEKTKSIN